MHRTDDGTGTEKTGREERIESDWLPECMCQKGHHVLAPIQPHDILTCALQKMIAFVIVLVAV